MRRTDNRFYWVSTESILDKHIIPDGQDWNARATRISCATVQGRIGEGNQINVNTRGLKQVTVWLGRDMMIDFDKPVTIRINGRPFLTNRRVPPNPTTLLEDLYLRGDRQRLFLARADFQL